MHRRKILKILLALSVLALLLAACAWFFPQQILTVDSGPVKADALVIAGGTPDRAVRAAELFRQNEAPGIIVSGFGDCDSNARILEKSGVPAWAITQECKSHTTRENAEFTIALLRARHAKSAIIVTSWYHSRRALHCFEHYAPEIKFYSRPSYFGYAGRTEDGQRMTDDRGAGGTNSSVSASQLSAFRTKQRAERKAQDGYVRSEYVKLLGYWARYGVWPL